MRRQDRRLATQALRLVLWAQRRAHVVPAPARAIASNVVRRLGRQRAGTVEPTEDWSIPLVGAKSRGNVESLHPSAAVPSGRSTSVIRTDRGRSVGRHALRCVIATGMLDVGGAEEFVAFLGRRLPGHGFETVVTYSDTRLPGQRGEGGRVARMLASEGVPTVELSPERCMAWLREHRPDVISTHYAPDWLLEAAIALGIPWVETLHDGMHSFLNRNSMEDERRRALRMSAQVAVSDLVRRQYMARNPSFPIDKFVTIPNGVDPARVAPVDRGQARAALGLTDEFLFVSLARYTVQKNAYGLVSAFGDVARQHPDAHLLVAGRADDPIYFTQTHQLARSLPFAERVHLRGHCANPAALLAAADAFVLDSFFEGWSLASMEALATGTPVVLSDVGGAREQVTGGAVPSGYLVANPGGAAELVDWVGISELRFRPQTNREEFARSMSAMVQDRVRWAESRDRLRDEAMIRFSADVCLARHAGVLRAAALGEPVPDYFSELGVADAV